ncbi:MAG: hypothetical protein EOM23_10600 [Candidatus Moranbacteria bacterium]|nr:hypothetical protein [Candidatus Moranbacteria bacterium]
MKAFVEANIQNAELHIYGNGDSKSEVINLCNKYSNLKYGGYVSSDEAFQIMKKANLLCDIAGKSLSVNDEKSAFKIIDEVVSKYGNLNYCNPGATALLLKAKYYSDKSSEAEKAAEKEKLWAKAEKTYATVWEKYKGSYGDKACVAAEAVAKHYEDLQQYDIACAGGCKNCPAKGSCCKRTVV